MEKIQCSKGHLYDKSLDYCPLCAKENGGWTSYGDNGAGGDIPETTPVSQFQSFDSFEPGVTVPVSNPGFFDNGSFFGSEGVDDTEETKPKFPNDIQGFDPVVGWLVCIKGPNRGKDYRLHSGNNFVGRDFDMDICVEHDQTITRRKAASIGYDAKTKTFFINNGEGRNISYINGKAVRSDADIVRYDRIEIGSTEFIFIPLCGEDFIWQDI